MRSLERIFREIWGPGGVIEEYARTLPASPYKTRRWYVKVWLLVECYIEDISVKAVYSSQVLAEEHAGLCGVLEPSEGTNPYPESDWSSDTRKIWVNEKEHTEFHVEEHLVLTELQGTPK